MCPSQERRQETQHLSEPSRHLLLSLPGQQWPGPSLPPAFLAGAQAGQAGGCSRGRDWEVILSGQGR